MPDTRRARTQPRRALPVAAGLLGLLACAALRADEGDVVRTVAARPAPLPDVFLKPKPESLGDLQAIEDHVQTLVERLRSCTVAVEVGKAQGSGVIVSPDGYVLTAAHVSGHPGRRALFILPDGRRVFGRTLGHNNSLDASLLKIDQEGAEWPYAEMGDTATTRVGDWCVVTGHPAGYQAGRAPVVRLGRILSVDESDILTDCELVGGDSGGPLFDMHGRVIAINSRIGRSTSQNLHVPIAVYQESWDRLLASESFSLHSGALLGVQGVADEQGVRLTRVDPNRAAGQAGLLEGDILTAFEDVEVHSIDELIQLVGQHRPESRVRVEILRNGQRQRFEVRLGRRES